MFLPPLLYSAAFFANLHELRRDVRPISLLAIGLVLATMGAVAVVAHALIDGLSWAAAFTLGAIVAPTDPLAATAIARRQNAPRRIVSILEGESLINDGTALVAYKVAAAAARRRRLLAVGRGPGVRARRDRRRAHRARRRLRSSPRSAAGSTTSRSRSRSRC